MNPHQKLIDNFKIRASAASKIMGIKGLGKTGEGYLESWLKGKIYGREVEIKSKYLSKGNQCEEDGFTLLCVQKDLGMVYKNKISFENDYETGTPDLVLEPAVWDNKCAWSLDTFPIFDKACPNDDYWWQGQVYMDLTGKKKFELGYTLIDAPEDIVAREVKWLHTPDDIYKKITEMVYTKEYFETLKERFCPLATLENFVEIPEEKRIKVFEIDFDADAIKRLQGRVLECRVHLNKLIN